VADFRVVWVFTENNGASFNEVYYVSATDAKTAAKVPMPLIVARLNLLHNLNNFTVSRASLAGGNRVTGFKNINLAGTIGATGGPAPPGESVICNLVGSSGGVRKLWLRGCPQRVIVRDGNSGRDNPSPGFLDLLGEFFTQLQAAGYGLRQVQGQTPGPLTNLKILSVDGSRKDGTSDFKLSAAPGYPYPSRVIVGGASKKDLPAANGRWSLSNPPVGPLVTLPYQTPNGSIVTGGNSHMRQESYSAISVFSASDCGFAYFGTRTTKNPLTRSRGARRAARIRTSL
jgi:hypothetical protein